MAYLGPGDLKTYRVWAGLRGYSAAYATPGNNPCFDLYVSNVLVGTINILPSGLCDVATAVSLIGGGTGRIGQLYDQTGGGNHFTQATDSIRPVFTPNASGLAFGMPGMTFVSGAEDLATISNIPTTTQPWAMTMFAKRTSLPGGAPYRTLNTPSAGGALYLGYNSASNTGEFAASTPVTVSEIDSLWHSLVGIANGSFSIFGVDGVSTGGLNAGTDVPTGGSGLVINSSFNFIGMITQVGYSEFEFKVPDITQLNTNDQFWFTSPSQAGSSSGGARSGSVIRRSSRVINY